jgi:predicted AlkP superfamily pyrophosphatase or phosphodiesterase
MIHLNVLENIRTDRQRDRFLYPYYGKASIAELVPTVHSMFSVPNERQRLPDEFTQGVHNQKVVLMIIDGLGFHDLIRHGKNTAFFGRLTERGNLYPITSVFPSTTPAALTTLHTGLTPQEHGLPEWFTYFPEFETTVMPMEFRRNWSEERDQLLKEGGTGDMIYDGRTAYQALRENNIPSYSFVYNEYYPSLYSDLLFNGSEIITYHEGFDLMDQLRNVLRKPGPGYFHLHWGQIDRSSHKFGPGSREHVNTIKAFSDLVDRTLLQKIDPKLAEEVTVLIVADHGQVGIKHEDIIFLNDYPIAVEFLQRNSRGELILPTGSPNDLFLHIKPERLSEAFDFLKDQFQGIGEVMLTEDAIAQGLFGLNAPTQRFLDRIGNVMIVPYQGRHVWYTDIPQDRYGQLGMHGGLSEEEMLVPFGVARLSDLLNK